MFLRRNILNVLVLFLAILGYGKVSGQVWPVKVNRQWGLIDAEGKQVVEAKYDAVPHIGPEHASIVQNGQYGLIDHSGNWMVSAQYSYLEEKMPNLVWITKAGRAGEGAKWGLINLETGEKRDPTFDLIEKFSGKWARVNLGGVCDYESCEGGKWGIIDRQARTVLPTEYEEVKLFEDREAFVKSDSGWGRINAAGEITIIPKYSFLERLTPNFLVAELADSFGLLRNDESVQVSFRYLGLKLAGEQFLAYQKGKKWGLMDSLGTELTPALWDDVKAMPKGWVRVRDDRKWGVLRYEGNKIFNPVLTRFGNPAPQFLPCERDARWGAISAKGKQILPFRYDTIVVLGDTLARAKSGQHYKWFDLKGNLLRTANFAQIESLEGKVVGKIHHQGRVGLINSQGKLIVPPKYLRLQIFMSAVRAERQDGKWDLFYYDELGNPTNIRRIVVRREAIDERSLLRPASTNVGWFLTSGLTWGLLKPGTSRVLIKPTYSDVMVVPDAEISLVALNTGGKESWGVVRHTTGKVLIEPSFPEIFAADFLSFDIARIRQNGGRGYALLRKDGRVITHPNLMFVGEFHEGKARAAVGGSFYWSDTLRMDTLRSRSEFDRSTGVTRVEYQYLRNAKWGFLNTEGEWDKEPAYEGAMDFEDGVCRIKSGGKWGVADENWNWKVKPGYDFIEYMELENGEKLFETGTESIVWGFIDEDGELVIQPSFQEVGQFSEGMVRVRSEGLWGYADRSGNWVIEPKFRVAEDFSGGLALIGLERGWDFIDLSGSRLTGRSFLRAQPFSDGLACVQDEEWFGYIDTTGKFSIQPQFSRSGSFFNGYAQAWRKGDCGIIDKTGKYIIPPKYFAIDPFLDTLTVIQEGPNHGLLHLNGDFVLKPSYLDIGPFSDGLARVKERSTWGFINRAGEVVIKPKYANVRDFSDGLAAVFERGKWGYIDTLGQAVVPTEFTTVLPFTEGRGAVRQGNKWGFVDSTGTIVIPVSFDLVRPFQNGRAAVFKKDKGWGFVDRDGVVVIQTQFDEVMDYQNHLARVKKEGKWGLVNTFGAEVTLLKYDDIGDYAEGLAPVKRVRQRGVLSLDGRELLPPSFDSVEPMQGLIQVESSDRIGYFSPAGDWVWEPKK